MAGALTISTLNDDTGVLAVRNGMTGIAKAWVKFDASGATSASFNISSVSKFSTGNWTLNFATALPSSNYVVVGMNDGLGGGSNYNSAGGGNFGSGSESTTAFSVASVSSGGGGVDTSRNYYVVFSA